VRPNPHAPAVRHFIVFLAATALASISAFGSEAAPDGGQPYLVTLEVTYGPSESFQVAAYAGQLLTLRDATLDYNLGIIPRVTDAAGGDLTLELVALDDPEDAGRPLQGARRYLGTLDGKVGFLSVTATSQPGPVGIRVLSVDAPAAPGLFLQQAPACERASASSLAGDPDDPLELKQVGGCCVTCGNITACGCAVSMSCGSCCGCSFC